MTGTAIPIGGGTGRASTILAAGTLVSRILGFVRALFLAAAIGQLGAGDAFAVGNQLPNNIFALIAGGLLSAVLVPQIVRAASHDDGGQRYINRVVTLGIVLFALVTLAATLAAPILVSLYAGTFSPPALALATAFAYWCLPQIFFYALYSLLSEVLNARKIFGPFTWAPVLNNVVSIVGLMIFVLTFGDHRANSAVAAWGPDRIALLGAVVTVGVTAQALILFWFWRRSGLRYRADFHWRGVGLGATGRAAGWLFGLILVTQIAGVFQTRVASIATGTGASVFALQNAWLIFMLPHSIAAVSIATAYFTRMSGHASRSDTVGLRGDLSASLRSIGLVTVFAMVALCAVAYPLARVFTTNFATVQAMSNLIFAFMPGLVLFSALFLVQRVFFALNEARTTFFIQCAQSALFIGGALLCALLPREQIGAGIAAVTTLASCAGAALALVVVRRRLGGIGARLILRRHLGYLGFATMAGLIGWLVAGVLGSFSASGFAQSGRIEAIVTVTACASVMAVVYFGLLIVTRNPQLEDVLGAVRSRLRRAR